MKGYWECKECGEEQYMSDEIMQSGTYRCSICGNTEFLYVCNGVRHEMTGKRKILKASMNMDNENTHERS
jgi:predicted  nucleic acid-binding Zn-ribbon protein